ncbi:MAG: hypothetical protein JW941_05205 [Candidatus Coatesbacteria bacterium]|nr:hypothetical protein [Candidatus Coatesbacteria bacterium]
MPAKVNFVVKTNDGKAIQIKKALTEAGIEVRAVTEVYREEGPNEETEGASKPDAPAGDKPN